MKHEQLLDIQQIAREAHKGQLRDEGKDYFDGHVYPVMCNVCIFCGMVDKNQDVYFLQALAFLHDVIEDCDDWCENNSLRDILLDDIMPHDVEEAEYLLTCLEWLTISGDRVTNDIYKQFSEKSKRMEMLFHHAPIEAIIVKIADRLHNISSMEGVWKPDRQRRYLDETKDMIFDCRDNLNRLLFLYSRKIDKMMWLYNGLNMLIYKCEQIERGF